MGLVFYFLALVNNINVRAAVSGAAHNTELLAREKESKKDCKRRFFEKLSVSACSVRARVGPSVFVSVSHSRKKRARERDGDYQSSERVK